MNKTESRKLLATVSTDDQSILNRLVASMVDVTSVSEAVATACSEIQTFASRTKKTGTEAWQLVVATIAASGAKVDSATKSRAKRIIESGIKRPTDPKTKQPLSLRRWSAACPILDTAKAEAAKSRAAALVAGRQSTNAGAEVSKVRLSDFDALDAVRILLAELGIRPIGATKQVKTEQAAYDVALGHVKALAVALAKVDEGEWEELVAAMQDDQLKAAA